MTGMETRSSTAAEANEAETVFPGEERVRNPVARGRGTAAGRDLAPARPVRTVPS